MESPTTMWLQLEDSSLDDSELEKATRQFREQLLELDIEDVRPAPGSPGPEGSKSGLGMIVGGLMVTLLQTPQAIASVLGLIGNWVGARLGRSVKITLGADTLELSGASAKEREAVIAAWLANHPGPEAGSD